MDVLTELYLMIISLLVVFLSEENLGNAIVNCAACQTTTMNTEIFNCKVQCDVLKKTDDQNYNISTMNEEIETLKQRLIQVETKLERSKIAFTAYESGPGTYGNDQIIVFNTVSINLGNGFDVTTGTFVAAVNGTYFFSLTFLSDTGGDQDASIRKNGGAESCAGFAKAGRYDTGTCDTILHLVAGDVVSVTAGLSGSLFHGRHTKFTGFLINVD